MSPQSTIFGKILRVNLTTNKITTEKTEPYAKRFLGGRGINQWILFNEVKPWMSPFDPANRLVFGSGALVGTPTPGACRFNVDSKNAFTGGVGSSNAGGHFSSELRFAGYDHIIFQGKARKPVYLLINDESVEIKDASNLWGRTTRETEQIIKKDLGNKDIQVASIGLAGENLVRSACIIAGWSRAAARCGLGAVMGSKNLKSIAVRGTGSIEVANPEAFMETLNSCFEKIEKSNLSKVFREMGTMGTLTFLNMKSFLPFRNFQDDNADPKLVRKMMPHVFSKFEERRLACFSCPIYCSHLYKINTGPYTGTLCEGFEANLAMAFTRMGVSNAPAMIKFQALCNEYGLDIDGVSCPIAWALECYERGIITDDDTDGLKLNWGDHEIVLELLKKTAHREGLGDILAEGCKRASEIMGKGSEKYAIHIKGQDLIETLRSCKGWALGVVVSPRGGTHTRGAPNTELLGISKEIGEELWGVPKAGEPTVYTGKPKVVFYYENMHAVLDSLGVCSFMSDWIDPGILLGPDDFASLLSSATGWKINGKDLLLIGERINNIEKAFNILHAQFSRENDYPPVRFMEEPIKSGPFKGEKIEKEKWDLMLNEYYKLHGWDEKTSWPLRDTLIKLDLEDVAEKLEKYI